jgi:hypothetical protein
MKPLKTEINFEQYAAINAKLNEAVSHHTRVEIWLSSTLVTTVNTIWRVRGPIEEQVRRETAQATERSGVNDGT